MYLKMIRLCIFILAIMLVACNGDDSDPNTDPEDEDVLANLTWDDSASTIILRMDSVNTTNDIITELNDIPLCTLWGDGRLLVVRDTVEGNAVYQGYLTDAQMKTFLQEVIKFGFYTWESDLDPIDADTPREVISLNLYDEVRTIERYIGWPVNGFDRMLELCRITGNPSRYRPAAGWLTAVEVTDETPEFTWRWSDNSPFTLAELAASDAPFWVESPLADELIWSSLREDEDIYFVEDDRVYQLALQVPGISRDSIPPPADYVPPAEPVASDAGVSFFDWDRSGDQILLRVDSYLLDVHPYELASEVPECTIWGDGRLIIANQVDDIEEVLEGYLTDEAIRGLIQNIVNLGFYNEIEEEVGFDAVTNSSLRTTITLNLADAPGSLEYYGERENTLYEDILQLCINATDRRAVVVPEAGWLYAYESAYTTGVSRLQWPRNAPFPLTDAAGNNAPRWLESPWADQFVWDLLREGPLQIAVEDKIYRIHLGVPGLSRGVPPAP